MQNQIYTVVDNYPLPLSESLNDMTHTFRNVTVVCVSNEDI